MFALSGNAFYADMKPIFALEMSWICPLVMVFFRAYWFLINAKSIPSDAYIIQDELCLLRQFMLRYHLPLRYSRFGAGPLAHLLPVVQGMLL